MSITNLNPLNLEQMKLVIKEPGARLRHKYIARLNLYKLDDGVEFCEFPLKCGYAQPIYMEENDYASLFNHPYILVRQKQNYKERLLELKRKIMGKRKKKPFVVKLGIEEYGGNFPLFVELLKQDPDKYFDGPYDFYYTGGSLTLSIQDDSSEICLVSVTGKFLDKLRVSQHSKNQTNIVNLRENGGIIYETYKHKGCYVVRQKNRITGLCLDDNFEDLLDLCENFTIDSKVPFLSSAFIADSKIATIDADQIIKFWDTETMCFDQSKKIEIKRKIDNWGYLKSFNESLMLYSNRSEFNVLDFRVPDCQTIGTYIYENGQECNKIYGMANSKFDNLVYISTNHALYGLDIRYLPEELSMNTVIKWTHLMSFPPIMIESELYDGREYIYLSSSLNDNKKICVNTKKTVYSSPYLPYKPKPLDDTYREIRLQGKCIDPISDFADRINLSTTGIGIFVKNDILHTIVSNASGDIFLQKFEDNEYGVPTSTIENMKRWVDYLRIGKCSKITHMDQMNSLLLAMQCKKLSLATETVEDQEEVCPHQKLKWQRSINELYQYKDVLAKNILDVWDMPVNIEHQLTDTVTLESQLNSSQLTYSSKIDEWFNRMDNIDQPSFDINPIDGNIANPNIANTGQNVPDILMETKQSTKRKRDKKRSKSKQLAGF